MKRISFLITLLSVFSIAALAGPIATPLQWTGVGANNHWYQLVQGSVSWDDAVNGATAMGGYLATITSADENFFVFAIANDPSVWITDVSGNLHGPRLGGNDAKLADVWSWVTSETWSYTNWYTGEPNFIGVEDSLAFFNADRPASAASTWNNVSKSSLLGGYVVEWDSRPSVDAQAPEPATMMLMGSALLVFGWSRRRRA